MKIHFIGIGGIGVSALARYYLQTASTVTGSDLSESEILDALRKEGAKIDSSLQKFPISNFQFSNKFQKPDLVIYTPAVEKDNPELKMYQEMGIRCQSYPEALGELTKKYFTIAVSGAHGKSTTTSMLALVLIKAGLDPTVIVGTKLKEFGDSNFRLGKSKYLLIEADEWNASFLNYWPKVIALTNIDREHLDYYHNLKNVIKSFRDYIFHLPKEGVLVANNDDKNIFQIINPKSQIPNPKRFDKLSVLSETEGKIPNPKSQILNFKIRKFSIKQKEAKEIKKILKVPGKHNVYNALAVLETARALGVKDKITYKALSEYKGVWRRFEESKLVIGHWSLVIISDYAHHPNEVKATLEAAREKYPKSRIWCVFQPHQYLRTYLLFKDFVKIFRQAQNDYLIDKMIVTDIYSVAGRESEEIKNKINSEKLVKKTNKKNVVYIKESDVKNYLLKNIKDIEVLIVMGAGAIYKLAKELSG